MLVRGEDAFTLRLLDPSPLNAASGVSRHQEKVPLLHKTPNQPIQRTVQQRRCAPLLPGVGVLVLAIACALAWWAYREAQKRELQEDVVVLVQDSTARLREALGLMTAGADARAKLEAHFAALKGSVGKAQALDASVYPALVQAATA
jgi:hypothetical protein